MFLTLLHVFLVALGYVFMYFLSGWKLNFRIESENYKKVPINLLLFRAYLFIYILK